MEVLMRMERKYMNRKMTVVQIHMMKACHMGQEEESQSHNETSSIVFL